jgi:dihydrofolate synthase/folylpolyglutamate synthase
VIEQIKNTPHEKLRFVLAMVNDKDVNKVLSMLDKDAEYYLSQAKIPRALPVDELAEKAQQAGLSFTKYATISQALAQAQQDSEENDLVFVGGSTFTVAEVV